MARQAHWRTHPHRALGGGERQGQVAALNMLGEQTRSVTRRSFGARTTAPQFGMSAMHDTGMPWTLRVISRPARQWFAIFRWNNSRRCGNRPRSRSLARGRFSGKHARCGACVGGSLVACASGPTRPCGWPLEQDPRSKRARKSAMMDHAVAKYFRRERTKAAQSYRPSSKTSFEQNIGLESHIRQVVAAARWQHGRGQSAPFASLSVRKSGICRARREIALSCCG